MKYVSLFLSLSLPFLFMCFAFAWQTECKTSSNKNLIYRFYVQNHTVFFGVCFSFSFMFLLLLFSMLVEHIKCSLKRTEVEFVRLTWTIFLSLVRILARKFTIICICFLCLALSAFFSLSLCHTHRCRVGTFLWLPHPHPAFQRMFSMCLLEKRNLKLMEYCFSAACVTFCILMSLMLSILYKRAGVRGSAHKQMNGEHWWGSREKTYGKANNNIHDRKKSEKTTVSFIIAIIITNYSY